MAVNSHHLLIRNATQKKTPGILIISQFVEFRGKRLTAWSFCKSIHSAMFAKRKSFILNC